MLLTFLSRFVFDGDERVELEVQSETPTIVLHAKVSLRNDVVVLRLGLSCMWMVAFDYIIKRNQPIHPFIHDPLTTPLQELLIKSASFTAAEGEAIELVNMNQDLKLHTLTLTFAAPLPVGA